MSIKTEIDRLINNPTNIVCVGVFTFEKENLVQQMIENMPANICCMGLNFAGYTNIAGLTWNCACSGTPDLIFSELATAKKDDTLQVVFVTGLQIRDEHILELTTIAIRECNRRNIWFVFLLPDQITNQLVAIERLSKYHIYMTMQYEPSIAILGDHRAVAQPNDDPESVKIWIRDNGLLMGPCHLKFS